MSHLSRRRVLRLSSGVTVGVLAGCVSTDGKPATESPNTSTTTDDTSSITNWERSTGCDSMHDSVISVKRVTTSLEDEYMPIRFADLSPDEQTILRTVTEEGGYGTCTTSEAFQQFLNRVSDHTARQDGDSARVYLERKGTYYGLYVEDLDQVYAY